METNDIQHRAGTVIGEAMDALGIGFCLCGKEGTVYSANRTFFTYLGKEKPRSDANLSDLSAEIGAAARDLGPGAAVRRIKIGGDAGPLADMAATADGTHVLILLFPQRESDINDDGRRAALESLEDGYYESDLHGIMRWINSAVTRITGFTREEVVGKSYDIFFDAEFARKIWRLFNNVYRTGVPAKLSNWTLIDKSGHVRTLESSVSPLRDASGTIIGFQGIIRDLTERVRIEKELIRARKLEAIGILAGGIAHDYNNALTAVLGNISLAKMEAPPDNKALAEVLDDAERASLRAVELTRRLSTFAQGGRPERKPSDIAELIRSTAETVLAGYGGTWEIRIQEGLWKAEIDEFQIGQVITYLIMNAVEASPESGAILIEASNEIIEREESHHELSLQPGSYVRVAVTDHGCGIPPELIPSIFDPYFTTKEMASGMGLATSYAIIKRHHGFIDVRSTVGEGSTFYFYVPAVDR